MADPAARDNRGAPRRHAWAALAALLALGALLGATQPRGLLEWQATSVLSQPWRCWSAAFTHLGVLHLMANLAGTAVVAFFGVVARCGPRETACWFLAWPLSHLLLLLDPRLASYAGLSGVLHAGVAVAALRLLLDAGRPRTWGALVLAGLVLKLLGEEAWRAPVQAQAGWDFPVAVLAHATGAAAGAALMLVVLLAPRTRRPVTDATSRGDAPGTMNR